ncbi:Protein PBDC1 [Orchesella cincta]|uniref:Protein PBDC1 n=1 Tax=Orchesella cincta TaxID=48709 RepID=A0A1D2M197_ORCCI|nr:Protein PBDC1 [Orchesella cincta]
MSIQDGVDAGAALDAASYLTRPAEEYVNDANVEAMWAVKVAEDSEIHYNLLCSADPKLLKLCKYDDWIYSKFRKQFAKFKIDIVDVDSLKSHIAKEKWRKFCEELKNVEDFSFGTLLRLNAHEEYSEENTILVTRVQFLAIEIARNREGVNDRVYNQYIKQNSLS